MKPLFPQSFRILLIVIGAVIAACNNSQTDQTVSTKAQNDRIEKEKSEKYLAQRRLYGKYELRPIDGVFIHELKTDTSIITIREICPGIIYFDRRPRGKATLNGNLIAIEYYDTITHQLIKRVDLDSINPYNDAKKYKQPGIGGVDYEFMDFPEISADCTHKKLPPPSMFLTQTEIAFISGKGFIGISFSLTQIAKPNILTGWEQTMYVFDFSGNLRANFNTNHTVSKATILKNGNYIIIEYGGRDAAIINPLEPCNEGLKIFDVTQRKFIYGLELIRSEHLNLLPSDNDKFIALISERKADNPTTLRRILLIYTDNQDIFTYTINNPEEADNLLKTSTFDQARQIIAILPHARSKF